MSTTALDKDTSFKADVNKILEDKTLSEQDKANAINQMVGSLYAGSSSRAYEAYLGRKPTSDEVLAFNAFLAKGGVGVVGGATPPALKNAVAFLNKNTGLGESDIASLAKAVGLSYNPTTDILFDPTSKQLTKVDTSKLGTTLYGADDPLTKEVENFQPGTPQYVQAFINRLAKDNPTLTAEDFKLFATKGYGLPDTAFTADPTKNTLGTLNIDKNMYLIPTSATTGAGAGANAGAGGNKIGGSGVDLSGESGLREFYGPYVQDFLSRMSAYLARYDQPKIKTENGQTLMEYYNPETKAQEWKPVKYEEKDGYTYIDGQALPRRPEFGVTYGKDTAKSLTDIQDELKRRAGLGTGTPLSTMYTPYQYTAAGIDTTKKASGGIASLRDENTFTFDAGGAVTGATGNTATAGANNTFEQNKTTAHNTLTGAQNLVNVARTQFGVDSPQYASANKSLQTAQEHYSYFTNPANNPTGNTTYTPTAGATGATSTFTAPTTGFTSNTYSSGYVPPTAYNAGTISSTYTAPAEYTTSNIASGFTKPADYVSSNIASTFTKPQAYTGNTISSTYTKPEEYIASKIANELFGAEQAAKYMSPYTSGVVDPQLREAKRQADLARLTQNAKFTQSGAFGGARNAIAEAELGRNLATQLGDIYGKGQQEAFLNAQQQFERDQQRALEAAKANELSRQFGYGQKTRAEEIAAQLGLEASKATEQSKQFGADIGLRGETTAAQLGLEAAKANELSRQFGYGQKLAAETTAAQLGLEAAKANELSRQFGYGQKASAARTAAELGLEASKASEQAKQEAGRQGLTAAEAAARLGLDASRLTESSKQFGATYGLDVARTTADYAQRAADLKQRAQEAYDTGNYRAAQLALDNLKELNRSQEATRTFDYTETRDTQLDPLRELTVAAQLLSGLPTSAGGQNISATLEAMLAAAGMSGLFGNTKTGG